MTKEPYTFHRFTNIIVNRNQLMKLLKSEIIAITKMASQPSHIWDSNTIHYKFLGYKLTCNIEIPTKYASKDGQGWCLFLDTDLKNYLTLEEHNIDESFWMIKGFVKTNKVKKAVKE